LSFLRVYLSIVNCTTVKLSLLISKSQFPNTMSYPPSSSSIHEITNTQINVSPGCQEPTSTQKQQIGVVLDLFQAKGTMAKLKDWLSDDAVYEDLFATCEGRDEVGELATASVSGFTR